MIDVLSTLQVVLREAGFTTRLTSIERSSIVCFEDDALLGFGCIFEDPSSLLERWKSMEIAFLKRYAPSVRAAGEKAWNVYCLFLCGVAADPTQSRQVRWVEEDLERTRKIAACGLVSRDELLRALLPILPLQYQPALRAEDVTERLQMRIRTIAPIAPHVVLDQFVSPTEVVRLLGGLA
ncbi:MAG: hypothetical protein Q7U76_01025 [Nitrospirota bacterium]|nr:hypothetical protein [Nitrospirota bacterium]